MNLCILLVIVGVVAVSATPLNTVLKFKPMQQQDSIYDIRNILARSEPLARDQPIQLVKWRNAKNPLTSFKWSDCGNSSSTVVFKDVQVSPDPIILPGGLSVSVSIGIKEDMKDSLSAEVKLRKIIGSFDIPIPCIDNVGSCDYKDVCSLLATVKCPDILTKHNIPCHCPFKKADYNLPLTKFEIKTDPVPGGDYSLKLVLYQKGTFAGCLDLSVSISS